MFLLMLLAFWTDVAPLPSGGPLSENQAAIDTGHLKLALKIDPAKKTVEGFAETTFKVLKPGLEVLELDLYPGLKVSKALLGEKELSFRHEGEKLMIKIPPSGGDSVTVRIEYAGTPAEAERPPWQGGFNWSKTDGGEPWVGVSCQGVGGKVWFPCKTHPSDKIDTVDLEITVPDTLYCASNGVLLKTEPADEDWKTFFWRHHSPISTYNVSVNIADYTEQSGFLRGRGRALPVAMYMLKEYQKSDQIPGDDRSYEQKKDDLFKMALEYLNFFEKYYGDYPFETFKVAHTAYLGMEHQTINSYGNQFKIEDGYDFLLFHEMGHEWWGNKVSVSDWADHWIHEGICTYTSGVYLETKSLAKALAFFADCREKIENKKPLVGGKNIDGAAAYTGDIYYKGALVIHSLRFLLGKPVVDKILKTFATSPKFNYQNLVASENFIEHAERISGKKLDWFFDVYLYQKDLPVLTVDQREDRIHLTWSPATFQMPVEVELTKGNRRGVKRLRFANGKASLVLPKDTEFEVDPNNWVLKEIKN